MTRDVRRYLTARRTASPTLAPDGQLAFLADTTGTMQVWTADESGAWPRQRTFYDERVSFVSWSPAGDLIAFGKDAGANEHDQLFVLDPANGAIDRLTDRPDAIHQWGGWSPDGDRIAFAANRRDEPRFDVYVMDVSGGGSEAGEPEIVCEGIGEGYVSVESWSPSGDRLLLSKARASSDDDLYVADVNSGERNHVTPHDGDVRYHQPAFGPDGEYVYCVSDANADAKELVRIDLDAPAAETVVSGGRRTQSGEPSERRSEDGDRSFDGFALDAASGRFALTRNVEGYSELRAGRLKAPGEAETVEVDLPDGVVRGLSVGPSGERAAVTVSTPDLNDSVFVTDLTAVDEDADASEPVRWTRPSPGEIPLDEYDAPDNVRYETFDGRKIPAYFTLPDDPQEGKTPVVVDIHGGPHHQRRPWFRPVRQYFLDSGYAVFEPNVRGSSGYGREYAALDDVEKRMDSVRDVAEAVKWLRERPEIDPEGVVAYGRSYGGFMVLAAITEFPDLWAAAVDFVGIANWVTFLENTGDWRRAHREAEYGSLTEDREFLEAISPIHSVEEVSCPLFVQHGENDPRVPVGEARQIAEEVGAKGVPVETCIFEDEGHHTTKLDNRIEQFERIAAFLDEHVQ